LFLLNIPPFANLDICISQNNAGVTFKVYLILSWLACQHGLYYFVY